MESRKATLPSGKPFIWDDPEYGEPVEEDLSQYDLVDESGENNLEFDAEEVFRQEVRLWLAENAQEVFNSTNVAWKTKKYTTKKPK